MWVFCGVLLDFNLKKQQIMITMKIIILKKLTIVLKLIGFTHKLNIALKVDCRHNSWEL